MKSFFAVLLALVVCAPVIRAVEPDEIYTEIYADVEKGDALMEKGNVTAAHAKYSEARKALRKLKADNPQWNTNAINYRLQYLSEKLAQTAAPKKEGEAASALVQSSEPVEMKVKWQVGKKYEQHMDTVQTTDMTPPGSPQPMQQETKQTQDVALTVIKELEGGGHEVEMEILGMTMSSKMAGQTLMNFDSKKTDDASNPVAPMFRKIIGLRLKFFTDAAGKIARVEGLEEAIQKMTAGSSEMEQGMVKGMFSEDALREMYSPGQGLPGKPVKPGDTWPVSNEMSLGPLGSVKMESQYTFKGWEERDKHKCVVLESTGTLTSTGGGNGMEISNGKSSGTTWFDPALGMVIDSTSKQSMNLKITAQGQTLNTKVNGTVNNKLVKISDAAAVPPQPKQ